MTDRELSTMRGGFIVYEKRCDQCLYSKDKIVGDARRKALLAQIEKDGTYFICHKASLAGDDVCCRGFYDAEGSQIVHIAKALNVVKFVPLPEERTE